MALPTPPVWADQNQDRVIRSRRGKRVEEYVEPLQIGVEAPEKQEDPFSLKALIELPKRGVVQDRRERLDVDAVGRQYRRVGHAVGLEPSHINFAYGVKKCCPLQVVALEEQPEDSFRPPIALLGDWREPTVDCHTIGDR